MEKVKVAVSIVTFNSKNQIRDVLRSILSSKTEYTVETIVVDNCSADETVSIVQEEFPNVRLIKNSVNVGYGRGHNQAIRANDAKYHLIVNPDITFQDDFIQKAIDYMEAHPEVVLFNPDIRGINGERKFPPKAEPRLHYLIPRVIKWKIPLFNKWRDEYTCKSQFKETPFEVGVCTGSFMVCRKSALDAVGGFDERYFLYYEDLDLSMMMKKVGKIQCNPTVSVTHIGSRAAYHSKKARNYMIDSIKKYYKKWGWKL